MGHTHGDILFGHSLWDIPYGTFHGTSRGTFYETFVGTSLYVTLNGVIHSFLQKYYENAR